MPVWVSAVLNFGLVRTPFAGRLQLVVVWITTETALHACKARLARNDATYMAPSPACCTSKDVNELDPTKSSVWYAMGGTRMGLSSG